jgi:DNA polymerase-3 subunit gamma/tau
VAELQAHFARIAEQEGVTIEPAALDQIARAADGSVRDGLSMLDQAIAQADGGVTEAIVIDMLGLADRGHVFELFEAVMAGVPRQALQITDRMYEHGADLGVVLQDLLELVHTLTRLKSVPALRDSQELPEAERTRGAALADRLSVPALARAWQMLLKGVGEVETAPDRRAAAEMVLIRLCHVAELPPPGDLVRRLTAAPATAQGSGIAQGAGTGPATGAANGASTGHAASAADGTGTTHASGAAASGPSPPRHPGDRGEPGRGVGGFAARTVAGASSPARAATGSASAALVPAGGTSAAYAASADPAIADPGADAAPARPHFATFRDVIAFVAEHRQAMLHAHLLHSTHLVRFAPPVIELRPQSEAPRDLAPKLAALLTEATGTRWTIAISTAPGEQTLAEQGNAADAARRATAADHPLVRAILDAFPGARIESVHDTTTDAYGLPAQAAFLLDTAPALNADDAEMPEFAPPDAEFSEDMEPDA